MRFTNKTHYGLQMLTFLAHHPGEYWSLPTLADELKIPASFLKHIGVALKKQRILKSQGGMYGGYQLAKPPVKITLAAILRALEEPIDLLPCQTKHCTHRTCLTGHFWEKVTKNITEAFQQTTLDVVIQSTE